MLPRLLQLVTEMVLPRAQQKGLVLSCRFGADLPHTLRGDERRFYIADSGASIPAHQQEAAFQPFEQVGAHRHCGSGLGLAISRQLVRRMGSDIRLRSRPGRGSVFSFEIAA